jgi:hypothetical protein
VGVEDDSSKESLLADIAGATSALVECGYVGVLGEWNGLLIKIEERVGKHPLVTQVHNLVVIFSR